MNPYYTSLLYALLIVASSFAMHNGEKRSFSTRLERTKESYALSNNTKNDHATSKPTRLEKDFSLSGAFNAYIAGLGTTLGHELGHLILNKKIYKCNAAIWVDPLYGKTTHLFFPQHEKGTLGFCRYYEGSLFKQLLYGKEKYPLLPVSARPHPITSLAGPIAGIATGVLILKGINVLQEYEKGKLLPQSITDGIKRPLFNPDQPLLMQLMLGYQLYINAINFLPCQKNNNDGTLALKAIHIDHTKKSIKRISACLYYGINSLFMLHTIHLLKNYVEAYSPRKKPA